MRGNDGAERERTIIERQVKHLTTLVDDLLDVSRITSGKIDLKRERIELGSLLARTVEIASPLVEQRRHELVVTVPGQGLLINADAIRGLPVMNGYELARTLRRRPDCAQLRLIAVTGYGQQGDIELALSAGFDEHLVKPVDLVKLEAALSRSASGNSLEHE